MDVITLLRGVRNTISNSEYYFGNREGILGIIRVEEESQKIEEFFLEAQRRYELRIFLEHLHHGEGFLGLETVVRVMHEVASGTKLAVLVLVVIATHLLSEKGLVADEFLDSVGKKTVVSVVAVASFGKTPAEL